MRKPRCWSDWRVDSLLTAVGRFKQLSNLGLALEPQLCDKGREFVTLSPCSSSMGCTDQMIPRV